jgi:hypothetical protein
MPPIEDRLDDFRRQQSQAQYSANVGRVDFLYRSELFDSPVCGGLQKLAPPEGARQCLDHCVINADALRHGFGSAWDQHQLPPATLAGRKWQADPNYFVVFN